MNKKLVLCVVLALSLILVGTGYAYWTDTLNVTTKATTGDLDVTFVDLGAYAQYSNEAAKGNWSIIDGVTERSGEDFYSGYVGAHFFGVDKGSAGYNFVFGEPDRRNDYYSSVNGFNEVDFDAKLEELGEELNNNYPDLPYGTGTIVGDKISITLNKIYPGYAQAFRSDIINIGSIAAKLSKVQFTLSKLTVGDKEFGVTPELKSLIGVALLIEDEEPVTYHEFVKLAEQFGPEDIFRVGGVDFVRLSAIDTQNIDIDENFILAPEKVEDPKSYIHHRADIYIGIAVDPDEAGKFTSGTAVALSGVDDSLTENKGIQVDMKLYWDQFNAGAAVYDETSPTNRLEKQN